MTSSPSLAILIPTYNDAPGLQISLDSLLAAPCPVPRITLVVDDGSDPPLILDEVRYRALGIELLRLIPNQGIEAALNRGVEAAIQRGITHLARLDAGDTIAPDRLSRQLALFEQNDELGIVGSSARYVDTAGKLLFVFRAAEDDAVIRRRMHINSCLVHPSVMIRMSVLEQVGPYSTAYPAAEDYDLFFRILAVTQARCIPEPLVTKLLSKNGISSRRRRVQLHSRLRIQCKNFCWHHIEAYLGVLISLVLLVLPEMPVMMLKRLCKVSSY